MNSICPNLKYIRPPTSGQNRGCRRRSMTEKYSLCRWTLTLFAVAAVLISPAFLASGAEIDEVGGLVLDIYADDAGKALVTGYAKSIAGLAFLNGSDYQYDEGALQLYAVTNALTKKSGDDWEIRLSAEGSYGEYHVTFYLSENVQLTNISGTEGLDYLVSSSSDSFVVEFHGYDVTNPGAAVMYRQPVSGAEAEAAVLPTPKPSSLYLLGGGLLVALLIVAAVMVRGRKEAASPPADEVAFESETAAPVFGLPEAEDEQDQMVSEEAPLQSSGPVEAAFPAPEASIAASISAEMVAVMDTLTERERSVLEALIKHEGRMTQADIRYETGIPKSSLTGIIVSLERRNIVTKKERGRTNVIELSERLNWGGR